ncbi:unnamed protein product [Cuscuta campestris]|uniref:DUF3615 domain-containing protein n=1 Tax=Cuscuta campestris TaxID=132261 RepID=A0A484KA45_9ASTE|nr:unnamed protein product [Cuscuta campestris]
MPEPLQVLCPGVNLPPDLLPDDTQVEYDRCGRPALEVDYDDPDDEICADMRDHNRYANLALAYYNDKHCTDYKVVKVPGGRQIYEVTVGAQVIVHCGFSASQSTAAECDSSVKSFFARWSNQNKIMMMCVLFLVALQTNLFTAYILCGLEYAMAFKDVINLLDCLKTVGCKGCDITMCGPRDPSWHEKKVEDSKPREDKFPLSKYAHYLADGVSLSDKARLRLPYPLLALDYYNKKHRTDYKLVDALPLCELVGFNFMIHLNFMARQEGDVSNTLFFAELETCKRGWVVTACRKLQGCKTTAGCYICTNRWGKRVIHPTSGFRFGRYPDVNRSLRKRR